MVASSISINLKLLLNEEVCYKESKKSFTIMLFSALGTHDYHKTMNLFLNSFKA